MRTVLRLLLPLGLLAAAVAGCSLRGQIQPNQAPETTIFVSGDVDTMLFFLALLYHAWVGIRDIVMDYVKPTGLRLLLQSLVGTALVFYLVWSVSILWGR